MIYGGENPRNVKDLICPSKFDHKKAEVNQPQLIRNLIFNLSLFLYF